MNNKENNLKKFNQLGFEKTLPALKEKHFKFLEQVKEEFKSSEEVKKERVGICSSCPKLKESLEIQYCDDCQCLLDALIDFKESSCPIGKWGPLSKLH
jgi:hypothetical protein